MRDLCMLRLLHAFCESMPLLLVQSYLLWTDEGQLKHLHDLNKVAIALSGVSVCWALASFGKNVRMQNVHRLVLTWLGVIFQVGAAAFRCVVRVRVPGACLVHCMYVCFVLCVHSSCGVWAPSEPESFR